MGSVKLHLTLYFRNCTPVCTDCPVVIVHISTPTLGFLGGSRTWGSDFYGFRCLTMMQVLFRGKGKLLIGLVGRGFLVEV
jgi:hypothetical protein